MCMMWWCESTVWKGKGKWVWLLYRFCFPGCWQLTGVITPALLTLVTVVYQKLKTSLQVIFYLSYFNALIFFSVPFFYHTRRHQESQSQSYLHIVNITDSTAKNTTQSHAIPNWQLFIKAVHSLHQLLQNPTWMCPHLS